MPRGTVALKALPEPDFLDFSLKENQVAVVTDDGSDATAAVVRALAGHEWKIVVVSFPTSVIVKQSTLPKGVDRIRLLSMDESELVHILTDIQNQHGQIAAFIHIHPVSTAKLNGGIHFPESDRAIVREVFLAAKHLKEPLSTAALQGRSIFMTVSRLDGAFGLSGNTLFNPVTGGLFGLVKTLNLEWEAVFCRALDISPQVEAGSLAEAVVAELYDPNRLICEVAYNLEGRSTLVVEQLKEGQ